MKNYRVLISLLVIGCLLWNAIYYQLDWSDWILVIISCFSTVVYVNRFNIWNDICSTVLMVTVFLSMIFIPTFQFAGETFSGGHNGYEDYMHLASFGNKIYFEFSFLCSILILGRSKSRSVNAEQTVKRLSDRTVHLIFLTALLGLAFGAISGSMYMGAGEARDRIVLPFHLNGIINVYTITVVPYLFAIIAENEILTRGKINRNHIYFFLLFGLAETFVRLSKSSLVSVVLPLALLLFVYYRPKINTIVRYAVPIVVIILFLYPLVQIMRGTNSNLPLSERIIEAYTTGDEEDVDGAKENTIVKAFNRQFMNGGYYMKYYEDINHRDLFDFSRAPLIVVVGGGPSYVTHILDGFPEGVAHSSGTTGTLDALLFGGYGFCYALMFILPFLASIFDSRKHRDCITYRIIAALLLMNIFNTGSISKIIERVSLMYIIGILIAMFFALKINNRTVKK